MENIKIPIQLLKIQQANAVLITEDDRGAQDGDMVTMAFEVFDEKTGKRIEHATSYRFKLSEKSTIYGIYENLLGCSLDDAISITKPYPVTKRRPDLAGQPVRIDIKIKNISRVEYQPLDDDFAQDFSSHQTLLGWIEEILNTPKN